MMRVLLRLAVQSLIALWAAEAMAVVPTITAFTPHQGWKGVVVTITGTGFTGATSVIIGNVQATVTSLTDTSIVATIGAESSTGPITVTTPTGTGTTAGSTLGNPLVPGEFESLCDPQIAENQSIAITDPSVIQDPVRTVWSNAPSDTGTIGHWTFNYLMSQLAPSTMTTSAFIKKWLINFRDSKAPARASNGNSFSSNTAAITNFLAAWPRIAGGAPEFDGTAPLNLTVNQFALMAIMIRPDLTGNNTLPIAGEGRFVFKNVHSTATLIDEVIFEFGLPISVGTTPVSWQTWNGKIHNLSTVPLPGAAYNNTLQLFTDLFVKKNFVGVAGWVNGSAIDQVRVNTNNFDFDSAGVFVLKEFHLTPAAVAAGGGVVAAGAGELVTWTTKNVSTDGFESLVDSFVKSSPATVLNGTFITPNIWWSGRAVTTTTAGQPGYQFPGDTALTVTSSLKKAYDMNMCNGCHSPLVNLLANAPGLNSATTNFFSNFQVQPCASGTGTCFASFLTGTTTGLISAQNNHRNLSMFPNPGPFLFSSMSANGTWKAGVHYSDIDQRAANLLNKIANPTTGGSLTPAAAPSTPNGYCL